MGSVPMLCRFTRERHAHPQLLAFWNHSYSDTEGQVYLFSECFFFLKKVVQIYYLIVLGARGPEKNLPGFKASAGLHSFEMELF